MSRSVPTQNGSLCKNDESRRGNGVVVFREKGQRSDSKMTCNSRTKIKGLCLVEAIHTTHINSKEILRSQFRDHNLQISESVRPT